MQQSNKYGMSYTQAVRFLRQHPNGLMYREVEIAFHDGTYGIMNRFMELHKDGEITVSQLHDPFGPATDADKAAKDRKIKKPWKDPDENDQHTFIFMTT